MQNGSDKLIKGTGTADILGVLNALLYDDLSRAELFITLFCASYDADSGGVEGAYYTWTPDEIIAVAGKDDGLLLCRLLSR